MSITGSPKLRTKTTASALAGAVVFLLLKPAEIYLYSLNCPA
jgi:hypothetical protein